MRAGLYLAAFELLKQSLVGHPQTFFLNGYEDGKEIISPEYEEKVLALSKHKYHASALWWEQLGAIDSSDVAKLAEIREHRDLIAHDMPRLIGTVEASIRVDLLHSAAELLAKIDNWWIINFELAINPDAPDHTEEELRGAASMSSLFLSLMLPIADGDDSKLRLLYEMWRQHAGDHNG